MLLVCNIPYIYKHMEIIIRKILKEETQKPKLNDIILKDLLKSFNKNTMLRDNINGDINGMLLKDVDFYQYERLLDMVNSVLLPHIDKTYDLNIGKDNDILQPIYLKWIKEMYGNGSYPLPGDLIEMVEMAGDDLNPIPTGTKGVVTSIKSHNFNGVAEEHLDVNWENKRSLRVLLPHDKIKIISRNI